ncbi:MAG: flippase [Steroidobacteraceae bacterium]
MSEAAPGASVGLIWRNTTYLLIAQILVVPLSLITNLLVARYLGPGDFGLLYLATTFVTFGFLFIEFGQSGALAGLIAERRASAGQLLASALTWRFLMMLPVFAVLCLLGWSLGYSTEFLGAVALMMLISALGTLSLASHDVFRGHERTDIGAITFVFWKLLILIVCVPVLLNGGRLHAFLWAQAACTAIGAVVMLWLLRRLQLTGLRASWHSIKELLQRGWPFFSLSLMFLLQENVNAVLLARYASAESVGWYAAASKLIGLLVYPTSALTAALYPTLSRLRVEDTQQFLQAAASALRVTVLCSVPVAAGCALFPELGVWVFDASTFGPTADNLRILSLYLLLVYISMPLSTTLMSGGRPRVWIILQLMCVVISAALNPWLIPWCESQFGNGGLGVSASIVLCETVMVIGAIWLSPKQLFNRRLLQHVVIALLGGAAMLAIATLMRGYTSWLVAPLSVLGYAGVLYATGLVGPTQLREMRSMFSRR